MRGLGPDCARSYRPLLEAALEATYMPPAKQEKICADTGSALSLRMTVPLRKSENVACDIAVADFTFKLGSTLKSLCRREMSS